MGDRHSYCGGVWGIVLLVLVGGVGTRAWGTIAADWSEEASLEWSVEKADLIVRGRVVGRKEVPPGRPRRLEVTLDVQEVMKGVRPAGKLVFWMAIPDPEREGTLSEVLVFLNRPASPTEPWEPVYRGVFVRGDKVPRVWRTDGTEVEDWEALLKGTREAAAFASKRGGACTKYEVQLPDVRLAVPKDARLEALGRRWIADPDVRMRVIGAVVLGEFRSAENEGRLKKLMTDPMYEVVEETDWWPAPQWRAKKVYPVRVAAGQTVLLGREEHAVEPLMRYSPVGWRGWGALGAVVLVAVLWPRKWGRLGIGGRIAVGLVGVMGLVGWQWWQTQSMVAAYSYSGGRGGDYEVVSGGGKVAVLRVRDDAEAHAWLVRRYEPERRWLWFGRMLLPVKEFHGRGLHLERGKTSDAWLRPYSMVILDYWLVMCVLGVWPVVWGTRVTGVVRRWRWGRTGRCVGCGYDLRGLPAGGRCPECGRGGVKTEGEGQKAKGRRGLRGDWREAASG